MLSRTKAVLGGSAIIALVSTTSAVAATQITSAQIQDNTIQSRDLRDGYGVGMRDMNQHTAGVINNKADKSYVDDTFQPKGDYATKSELPTADSKGFGPTTVATIGGPFSTGKTPLGDVSLDAGKYVLSSDGFFTTKDTTSGKTQMELALRDGSGNEYGTCFTGRIASQANRDITCATNRVITLNQPTTIHVYAFGYDADGQGGADSGLVDASAEVNILKVG